jgi:PIN domain nuclease of toxin-antitoxin system
LLLLDTCTFIWLASDPAKLSPAAAKAIDRESEIQLSDASVWEICLKWQSKKITLPSPPRTWVSEQLRQWRLQSLAIAPEHLFRCTELPDLHKDPFDRLLVAQALSQNLTLVTPDEAIRQYPVSVIW